MKKSTTPQLPPGEFFVYLSERSEYDSMSSKGSFDPNPELTTQIINKRKAYYRQFDPTWQHWRDEPERLDDHFHNHNQNLGPPLPAIPADLVHPVLGFKRPAPKRKPDDVQTLGYDYATNHEPYTVVADRWRDAILSLDPHPPEFYPVSFQFNDATLCGWSIKRELRQFMPYHEDCLEWVNWKGSLVWVFRREPQDIILKREVVHDRHWFRPERAFFNVVSRQLANVLLPYLPRKTALVPVAVKP
jgi:hypothetical protein